MEEHERHGAAVSRDDLGTDWPLTVDSGTIYFDDEAVMFTAGGTLYALNGTAKARGHTPVDPIWADHEEFDGLKKNIGPLIEHGRRLAYGG